MRQGYKFIRESGCEHDDDYLSHLFNDIFCWTNGTYKLCYTRPDMEAVNNILVNQSEALEKAFQKITQ